MSYILSEESSIFNYQEFQKMNLRRVCQIFYANGIVRNNSRIQKVFFHFLGHTYHLSSQNSWEFCVHCVREGWLSSCSILYLKSKNISQTRQHRKTPAYNNPRMLLYTVRMYAYVTIYCIHCALASHYRINIKHRY